MKKWWTRWVNDTVRRAIVANPTVHEVAQPKQVIPTLNEATQKILGRHAPYCGHYLDHQTYLLCGADSGKTPLNKHFVPYSAPVDQTKTVEKLTQTFIPLSVVAWDAHEDEDSCINDAEIVIDDQSGRRVSIESADFMCSLVGPDGFHRITHSVSDAIDWLRGKDVVWPVSRVTEIADRVAATQIKAASVTRSERPPFSFDED